MDGNWKFNISLLTHSDANTSITRSLQIPEQENFSAFGKEQKQSNKGNFQLLVDVHGTKMSA